MEAETESQSAPRPALPDGFPAQGSRPQDHDGPDRAACRVVKARCGEGPRGDQPNGTSPGSIAWQGSSGPPGQAAAGHAAGVLLVAPWSQTRRGRLVQFCTRDGRWPFGALDRAGRAARLSCRVAHGSRPMSAAAGGLGYALASPGSAAARPMQGPHGAGESRSQPHRHGSSGRCAALGPPAGKAGMGRDGLPAAGRWRSVANRFRPAGPTCPSSSTKCGVRASRQVMAVG